jgi:uncharacterized protein
MPEQEHRLKRGDQVRDIPSQKAVGSIHNLEAREGWLELRIGESSLAKYWAGTLPSFLSIAAQEAIDTSQLEGAILRVAESRHGIDSRDRYPATWDLVRRTLPRLRGRPSGSPVIAGDFSLETAFDAIKALDGSYLIIQGPPGTGKTYTGARIILRLLSEGKRVGVCATSHKAISNLLRAVSEAAVEAGQTFVGARKGEVDVAIPMVEDIQKPEESLNPRYRLVGGTAWIFAREDADQTYDYLFVDEAGQVSLANIVAMGCATRNLVLLGDQMQLGQPLQGTHPGDSGLSALDYALRDHATVPPESGIFLGKSYRMHPGICAFISKAVYEGRLTNDPRTETHRLVPDPLADPAIKPAGIVFEAVEHSGCSQTSKPEAERIAALAASLLGFCGLMADGKRRELGVADILVVAPYNAQVRLLKEILPPGIPVGTVDKFQGQEAEVVIVSMTTSGSLELPRNLDFLFDRRRLNVAISRAKTLAIVVASPGLLEIDCRSPEQMALVDTLCWVADSSGRAS